MNTIYLTFYHITISDWSSLISLAISAFSIFYSWKTRQKIDKQQLVINKHVISNYENEKENMKKADIECSTSPSKEEKIFIMTIKNSGKAPANNIFVNIIDNDDQRIKMDIPKEMYPYPKLLPNHCFEIKYQRYIRYKPCYKISLKWDDEFGKEREKQQIISL